MGVLKLFALILATIVVVIVGQESGEADQIDRQNLAQVLNFLKLLLRQNKLEIDNSIETESEDDRQLRNTPLFSHEKKKWCLIQHNEVKLNAEDTFEPSYYNGVTCTTLAHEPNDKELNTNRSKYCIASGNTCKYKSEKRPFIHFNSRKRSYETIKIEVPVGCICKPIPDHTYVVTKNIRSLMDD